MPSNHIAVSPRDPEHHLPRACDAALDAIERATPAGPAGSPAALRAIADSRDARSDRVAPSSIA